MSLRSAILLAAVLVIPIKVEAQDQIDTGTVNIIMANSQGIVVLTDSQQTKSNAGIRMGSNYAQKLIRLDDQSVCTLAGFASAPDFLRLDVMGILADFGNQLKTKSGKISFVEKLRSISFLISLYMDALSNAKEVLRPGKINNDLRLHIFIAGIDSDGVAKIGSMWLNPIPALMHSGKTQWQFHDEIQVQPVGKSIQDCKFVRSVQYCIAGIPNVADRIMQKPEEYARNPAIKRMVEAGKRSLSLLDLEALAKFLSSATSRAYGDYVGGPDQVAIFQGNKLAKFDEPFPSPAKPISINLCA